MFVITDAWLMKHSRAAARTRDQFNVLHIPWPPPRGWKWRVIGKTITDQQKARFEMAMRSKQARAEATLDLFE
jgi:hypothetical protein